MKTNDLPKGTTHVGVISFGSVVRKIFYCYDKTGNWKYISSGSNTGTSDWQICLHKPNTRLVCLTEVSLTEIEP